MIRIGGLTYWEIKCRALNGHRSKLSDDQLGFVGFVREQEHEDPDCGGWSSSSTGRRFDKQHAELAALLDTMPGYFALARKIVEDERGKS